MAALAIRDGWVPGTVNLVAPEPDLAALLPGLLREGRDGRFDRVLSTSFGFGGLNAALVLGAAPDTRPRRTYPDRCTVGLPTCAHEVRRRAMSDHARPGSAVSARPLLSFPAWAADDPDRLVLGLDRERHATSSTRGTGGPARAAR